MSRAAREKGKRGEQAVAALLAPVFPDVRTKRAGGESASVDRGRDLLGTPGWCVQVKEMLEPSPFRALDEAYRGAEANEIPVAFVKRTLRGSRNAAHESRGRWCVILPAEEFVGLLALSQAKVVALAGAAATKTEAKVVGTARPREIKTF